ncbi:MAG: dTMP kinase [Candidatus Altiarchaeota archaeon]|nr:dTMP kinase [Candidatus Altiarchaeota archaeon]
MFLVSIDGPDFSGKTTIATSLLMRLREKGVRVERTELPSRMVTGSFTQLIRNSKDQIDPRVFALVYATDHLHHHLSFIKPQKADIIIMERSLLTSFIYQGMLQGVDMGWLKEVNKHNKTRPDLSIILKTDYTETLKRKSMRLNEYDVFEEDEFLEKLTKTYYDLPDWAVQEFNVKYVEQQDIEQTTKEIIRLMRTSGAKI